MWSLSSAWKITKVTPTPDVVKGSCTSTEVTGQAKRDGNILGYYLNMTTKNFREVTDTRFIVEIVNSRSKIFMMIEYTPVTKETENWVLTPQQRTEIIKIRNTFRANCSALFIALPLDEKEIVGCLSAGRGFIHVSAEGNVEPCQFAPYSDTILKR